MNIKKLTALALADMALATDASLQSLIAACKRVFDAEPAWVPAVCAALIERTGEDFHYYSRQELAGLLLECLGHVGGGAGAGMSMPMPMPKILRCRSR